MGFGATIYKGGERLWACADALPASQRNSCNVAEYLALIMLLNKLGDLNYRNVPVKIYGDSNLVINQMSGKWKVTGKKGALYVSYAQEAAKLLDSFSYISFQWIPREQNEECDQLSKKYLNTIMR